MDYVFQRNGVRIQLVGGLHPPYAAMKNEEIKGGQVFTSVLRTEYLRLRPSET